MDDIKREKAISPVETAERLRAYIWKAMDIIDVRKDNPVVVEQGKERIETYLAAEEAVNKQIPKKPTDIKISFLKHSTIIKSIYGKCPICGTMQADDEYCQHCGQALDWKGDRNG